MSLLVLTGAGAVPAQAPAPGAATAEEAPVGVAGTRRSPSGWPAVAEKRERDSALVTSEILSLAHYANEQAMEIGALARTRGASERVRRYGHLVVADHQRVDRQILAYARRRGGISVESTSLAGDDRPEMQEKMRALQELRGLRGEAFDRQVLALAITDSEETIANLQSYRQMVDDPELRTLFYKTAPILEQHVAIADALASNSEGR